MNHTEPDSAHLREIRAKSLLRKQKAVDSWFLSSYGMNLYRGCTHGCTYCDGRSEEYYVEGDFTSVQVKTNAAEVLERELNPARKRTPFGSGYFLIGGGVGDSFQPAEQDRGLTRGVLEVMERTRFPVHLLTKSASVTSCLDILKRLASTRSLLVSFSFSSSDDGLSRIFEPGASLPSERLEAVRTLRRAGIHCGMYLMPLIPFITDTPDRIRKTLKEGVDAGIEYAVYGAMTLKDGRQRTCFYGTLHEHFRELIPSYDMIYTGDRWGNASDEYQQYLHEAFREAARPFTVPRRIPPRLFPADLSENERAAIILEHLESFQSAAGNQSTYGWAARSVRALEEPLTSMRTRLKSIQGVGPATERLLREIIDSGTSQYYEKLLKGMQ